VGGCDGQFAHPGSRRADARLATFLWALAHGQFEDPEGSAERILFDDEEVGEK